MGVDIEAVDYDEMPGKIEEMRKCAVALNTNFTNAYDDIKGLSSTWYGRRYNDLAKIFNDIRDDINKLLRLVVGTIPTSLDQVANNYSQADQGINITTVTETSVKEIDYINPTPDKPLGYKSDIANQVQEQVESELNLAISNMDEYESVFNTITWISDAATRYKSQFQSSKNSVSESINNIKTQFTKLMEQAANDIISSDNSNG